MKNILGNLDLFYYYYYYCKIPCLINERQDYVRLLLKKTPFGGHFNAAARVPVSLIKPSHTR